MVKKMGGNVGRWAALASVLLAALFGLWPSLAGESLVAWVLVLLGLVVGLLNVEAREVSQFLTAGTVLALMGFVGGQALNFPLLGAVFNNLLAVAVPATVVVALKSLWSMAKA